MKNKFGILFFWVSIVLTVDLFVFAKFADNGVLGNIWLTVSQLASLLGTTLLGWSFLLSGRFRFLEEWFGGLDKVYKKHHIYGGLSFVLLLHHPLFLAVNAIPNMKLAWMYFWPASTLSYNYGIFSLYFMMLMLILTLLINLPYNLWKKTHELMGVALIFASLHILTISSDVSRYLPLRYWVTAVLIVSVWSVIYKRLLYNKFGPKYEYVVDKIHTDDSLSEIWLRPHGKHMKYLGGQFAFIRFSSLGSEPHPFSMASMPKDGKIRVAVKDLGDYTKNMSSVKEDSKAVLWGPYGKFWEGTRNEKNQVWIAGGIGITPFLALLDEEVLYDTSRTVDIFYCISKKDEDEYGHEIRTKISGNHRIRLWLFCSEEKGRIDSKHIQTVVSDIFNSKILICGPVSMMEGLASQFRKIGVKNRNIIFEDFNFK